MCAQNGHKRAKTQIIYYIYSLYIPHHFSNGEADYSILDGQKYIDFFKNLKIFEGDRGRFSVSLFCVGHSHDLLIGFQRILRQEAHEDKSLIGIDRIYLHHPTVIQPFVDLFHIIPVP